MAEIKLVIADPKTKRSFKSEIKSPEADQLMGKKIGDTFRGELISLSGFEFQITGGSDNAGFPMFKDIESQGRRRLILDGTKPGFKAPKKFTGIRVRKLVRGNTVAADITQINCKITKHGDIDLMKHFNIIEKPKEEEKKEEAKPTEAAPEKKEEVKPEEKPVEKIEKPIEPEKKEEAKKEKPVEKPEEKKEEKKEAKEEKPKEKTAPETQTTPAQSS